MSTCAYLFTVPPSIPSIDISVLSCRRHKPRSGVRELLPDTGLVLYIPTVIVLHQLSGYFLDDIDHERDQIDDHGDLGFKLVPFLHSNVAADPCA
jgi:hypothetical protein